MGRTAVVVAVVVVGTLAAAFAYAAGDLRLPGRAGSPSTSGTNGTPGNGGTVLVSNGTSWPIGPRHYEGAWCSIGFTSEILGTFRASSLVTGFILSSAGFVAYIGANSSYGAVPAAGAPSASNWTSGPSMGGYIDTFLDPGSYEIFFVNSNGTATATVQLSSDLVASVDSVG